MRYYVCADTQTPPPGPERAAVIIGILSVRAPAPEQGRLAQAMDPVLVEEAGAGPGAAGGGARVFAFLDDGRVREGLRTG